MNLTYIGLPNECGTKICNSLSVSHKVTMITDQHPLYEIECDIVINKSMYVDGYFDNKSENILIYNNVNGNYKTLNKWLAAATGNVDCVILINENTLFKESEDIFSIEELLCSKYSAKSKTKAIVINTSVLYGSETIPAGIEKIVKKVRQKNILEAPENFVNICDILHIDDLCSFLNQYINEISEYSFSKINVQSGYSFSTKELFGILKTKYPQAQSLFDEKKLKGVSMVDSHHFEEWTPKHSFLSDLNDVLVALEERMTQTQALNRKGKISIVSKVMIFFIAFLAMELYINFISVASDLQFVDLRILFIAFSAVLFNRKFAISASVLCSIANIVQSLLNGYKWHVVFFHINNWIPLVIYVIFATLIGTYIDHLKEQKSKRDLS